MTAFRRLALIIPALLIALPAAAFTLVTNPAIDLAGPGACPAPTYSGATATVTCNYIGGQQTWTAPAGITSATFAAYGAQGGTLFGGGGGGGGEAVATMAVTPQDIYTIVVGGAGGQGYPSSGAAGYNGGGAGGSGAAFAGGGGGASDVRFPGTDLGSRLLVGGGGGGGSIDGGGGGGGGLTGIGAGSPPFGGFTGGGPGTQLGGGGGGSGGCCGTNGADGGLGTGGAGGSAGGSSGGGGGGGGYYGGGGGGDNVGAGGGSGFGPVGTTFTDGVQGGDGVVVISYTRITTSFSLTSSQNPSVFGQSITLTATVSGAGGTPSGTVTFLDGGTSIGTQALTGGVATFSTSSWAVGSHTITASYGGDFSFDTSTGAQSGNPQVVNAADTSTSVSSSQNPSVFGAPVTFSAHVTPIGPGSGTPTGTVSFVAGGSVIGSRSLSGGSIATFTTSALAVGAHTITTTYPGDGNFNASGGAMTGNPQVVNKTGTTTSVNSTSPSLVGQAVTFTASVTVTAPGTGVPTGTFAFANDGTAVSGCQNVGVASGTCAITETSAGPHIVRATYSGDADHGGSTGSITQSVNAASTTTMLTASPTTGVVGGENVSFTATVSVVAPGGGAPTGSVTFSDGTTLLGSAVLVANAGGDQATFTTPFATGMRSITATYPGDADFTTSTSSPVLLTVATGVASVTNSSTPNPTVAGQSVTLRAAVIPKAPSTQTPTGSVSFYDGTTLLGTALLPAAAWTTTGPATVTIVTSFAAGSHTLTAVYSGNAEYASASSPPKSDVEAVNAIAVPSTGAAASSMVELGALLILAGLAWTGASLRKRHRTLRSMR